MASLLKKGSWLLGLLGLHWFAITTTKGSTSYCNYVMDYTALPTDICINDYSQKSSVRYRCVDSTNAIQEVWKSKDCQGDASEVYANLSDYGVTWVCDAPKSGLECDLSYSVTYANCSDDTPDMEDYVVNGICVFGMVYSCVESQVRLRHYETNDCQDLDYANMVADTCENSGKVQYSCAGTQRAKSECQYGLMGGSPVPTKVCMPLNFDSESPMSVGLECADNGDMLFSQWDNLNCEGSPADQLVNYEEMTYWTCDAEKLGTGCPRTRARVYGSCEDATDDAYLDIYILNDQCVPWTSDDDEITGQSAIYTCNNDELTTKVYYTTDCTDTVSFTSSISTTDCDESEAKVEITCDAFYNRVSFAVFISYLFFVLF